MSTKHFIDDATHLVATALHSLTLTNPNVALDPGNKIIYRRPSHAPTQVSVLSGGGSGHEPSFAGMVGPGMLSAAVAGTIFASPSAEQVRVGITSRVDTDKGVLVVVMNYTGDVLNFGVAVEKAKAQGLHADMVVVGDDVGVGRKKAGKVGRRGIAGTVLVLKIAGALAAKGYALEDVAKVARLTAQNMVSVGASLDHVHVPGRAGETGDGDDGSGLASDEVELGMGIHNEPGFGKAKRHLKSLVETMLNQLLDQNDKDRAFVNVNSNEVVLFINNLGGLSPLEIGGIITEVVGQLEEEHNVRPVRIISGTFMTSLNGPGFSITLLNVVNTDIGGPSMIDLLDAPSEVAGWSAPIQKTTWEAKNTAVREETGGVDSEIQPSDLKMDANIETTALKSALQQVISVEPELTRFDTLVGDGDCGIGMKRGAQAVLEHIEKHPLSGDVVVDVASIVPVIENNMDGTSGALYAIFMNALIASLRAQGPGTASPSIWAAALKHSCDALSVYTPARPGDRTLIDALYPFVEELTQSGNVKAAAQASKKAAYETKGMQASLGRSVYVGGSSFEEVPDPGAWGLACFFLGLADEKPTEEDWEEV